MQPAHWFFDRLLRKLEGRRISSERLADVMARLVFAAPHPLSQSEIASGRDLPGQGELAPDSVSRATSALTGLKLVSALPAQTDKPGRPYTPLQLGGEQWAMVGVKVGHAAGRPVSLDLLVTSLGGQPITIEGRQASDSTWQVQIPEGEDLVDAIAREVEDLCDRPEIRNLIILGVGVEIAGHVFNGKVIEASHSGMKGEQLDEWLSERLGGLARRFGDHRNPGIIDRPEPLPVIVDNDVNVLAVLEAYNSRYSDRDVAVIAVFDEGIGAALLIDGRVYRGARGMAGEIGHCLVPIGAELTDDQPVRRYASFSARCHCGKTRHLDCYATPVRILSYLQESDFTAVAMRPPERDGELTVEGFAFTIAGQALGYGIAGMVNVMNPSRVLVYLPPPLVTFEPDSVAERYDHEMRRMFQAHSFSDAGNTTEITVEPMTPDRRRFLGAQAAALRVVDSFIEHARQQCSCFAVPPPLATATSTSAKSAAR